MIPDLTAQKEIHLRLSGNDIRSARFLEVLQDKLISIEQTAPPLAPSLLMSIVFFTYCPDNEAGKRLGFEARIETITPDHRIFLRQLSDPFPCDLRQWRRVRLDLLPPVRAFCHDREIQVIDLSGGGAHLALHDDDPNQPTIGATVPVKFIFEEGDVLIDAEIIRQWTDPAGMRHLGVQFTDPKDIRKMIYK